MKPSHQGRYPRTLQEAFGPYATPDFAEREETSGAVIVYRVFGVIVAVLLAAHLFGRWLA